MPFFGMPRRTPFQLSLARTCAGLGVRIELQPVVTLPDGITLRAEACLPDFGAPMGMLVFHDDKSFQPVWKTLVAAGFGFTVFGSPQEEVAGGESFAEMLADWGWSGAAALAPRWLGSFLEN